MDVRPGTPGSPDLGDGGTIGPSQTSAPVQLDQVLGTLKATARRDLQKLLQGYGESLNGKPTAARGRHPGPGHAGPDGGRVAERLAGGRARRAAPDGHRERGLPGHLAGRPGQADQGQPAGVRRAGAQRGQPQGPDHQLQHHHRRPGQPAERPARNAAGAPAGAGGRQPGVRQAQRLVPGHAGVRARDHPRRPRDARHHHGLAALDRPDARAGAAQRAGRLDRPPAARREGPGQVHRRHRDSSCPRSTPSTAARSTTCCPPATPSSATAR